MQCKNEKGEEVRLTAGSTVSWNEETRQITYLDKIHGTVSFFKTANSDSSLNRAATVEIFRTRAMIAARFSGLNIEPIKGAYAFKFV